MIRFSAINFAASVSLIIDAGDQACDTLPNVALGKPSRSGECGTQTWSPIAGVE